MSFSAKLTVDSIEYNVLGAEYRISQSDDGDGMPNSRPKGGKIKIKMESVKNTDFLEWAVSSNALKNGNLTLLNRDNVSSFRSIDFKNAYCLDFFEKFDGINDEPLYTEIIISAKELDVKGTKFQNNWPVKLQ